MTAPQRLYLDWPVLARAASTGFTVLVVGGLLQPFAGRLHPWLGVGWLPAVAVAAFAVAGWRAATTVHGVLAAVGSYLLALPLVVMATRTVDVSQVALTVALAVAVGWLTGWVASRRAAGRSADGR